MLEFNEEKHLYKWNGEPVPAVSDIIKAVMPEMDLPTDMIMKAGYRGKAFHALTELYDKQHLYAEMYINDVAVNYLQTFNEEYDMTNQFVQYQNLCLPEWQAIESQFYYANDGLSYCGTVDRQSSDCVYDIKTQSSKDMDKWNLQLTAYAMANGFEKGKIIWIPRNKIARIIDIELDKVTWLSCLTVFYKFHYKNWIKKVG